MNVDSGAVMPKSRELDASELELLAMIQAVWGAQNSADLVSLTADGEAQLWVIDRDQSPMMFLSVTNLAEWHRDGTLTSAKLAEWTNSSAHSARASA